MLSLKKRNGFTSLTLATALVVSTTDNFIEGLEGASFSGPVQAQKEKNQTPKKSKKNIGLELEVLEKAGKSIIDLHRTYEDGVSKIQKSITIANALVARTKNNVGKLKSASYINDKQKDDFIKKLDALEVKIIKAQKDLNKAKDLYKKSELNVKACLKEVTRLGKQLESGKLDGIDELLVKIRKGLQDAIGETKSKASPTATNAGVVAREVSESIDSLIEDLLKFTPKSKVEKKLGSIDFLMPDAPKQMEKTIEL